jgi:hypothetical protein
MTDAVTESHGMASGIFDEALRRMSGCRLLRIDNDTAGVGNGASDRRCGY